MFGGLRVFGVLRFFNVFLMSVYKIIRVSGAEAVGWLGFGALGECGLRGLSCRAYCYPYSVFMNA